VVSNLQTDLQNGKYVSASTQARTILEMSKNSDMPALVVDLARKAVAVLAEKGYTEEEFLRGMQAHVQGTACPPDAIPANKDGSCPLQYFPILGQAGKTKCCAKIKAEVNEMDQVNLKMLGKMQRDSRGGASVAEEFEQRFALVKGTESYHEKQEMLSANVPDHTRQFMKKNAKSEELRMQATLESAMEQGEGHKTVGMSEGLFAYLIGTFKSTAAFINWYVNHDWTRWWVAIYIFRVLSMFVCMWLEAENVKEWMDKLAESYLGFKPVSLFLAASWGPMVLAGVIFNTVMNQMAGGKIFIAVFNGIQGALGGFMTLGFFHFRIMSLFTTIGFSYDLAVVFQEIFTLVGRFGKQLVNNWAHSGSVTGAITEAAGGALRGYCHDTINTFFSQALKMVQEITFNLFYIVCLGIAKIITMGPILGALNVSMLKGAPEQICSAMSKVIRTFISYFEVSTSIHDLINGEVKFAPGDEAGYRSAMNDLNWWHRYGTGVKEMKGLVPYDAVLAGAQSAAR